MARYRCSRRVAWPCSWCYPAWRDVKYDRQGKRFRAVRAQWLDND